MKKVLLLVVICLATVQAMAQLLEPAKQVYKSPNLKEAIKSHMVVAILPLNAQITYRKKPRHLDSVEHIAQEQELGYSVQSDVYNALMHEFFKYKVRFQNVMETNQLLQQNGMADNLDAYSKQEIARALGVDAVIFGEYLRKENTANVGTVAVAMVGYYKTAEVTITLKIANAADGEIVWRYSKKMNEMGSSEARDVFDRQMEKLTRNLPYTRGIFSVF